MEFEDLNLGYVHNKKHEFALASYGYLPKRPTSLVIGRILRTFLQFNGYRTKNAFAHHTVPTVIPFYCFFSLSLSPIRNKKYSLQSLWTITKSLQIVALLRQMTDARVYDASPRSTDPSPTPRFEGAARTEVRLAVWPGHACRLLK